MNKIFVLKTFPTKEQANTAMRQFVEDHSEGYCKINTRVGCVNLPNSVIYFATMSDERHLSLAYGAQYQYVDFYEGIPLELKRYLQTRIRGVYYD